MGVRRRWPRPFQIISETRSRFSLCPGLSFSYCCLMLFPAKVLGKYNLFYYTGYVRPSVAMFITLLGGCAEV